MLHITDQILTEKARKKILGLPPNKTTLKILIRMYFSLISAIQSRVNLKKSNSGIDITIILLCHRSTL